MSSVLRFIQHWFAIAASDVVRRMGTTGLALGIGLAASAVSLLHDLWQGIRPDWSGGLLWGIGFTGAAWLFLLVLSLRRHFRPLLREHRRVFRMLALNQDPLTDPDRISIWCLLQFSKDIGPAELIVRVTTLLAPDPITRVVHTEKLGVVSRDERKRLRLASLRIARSHGPPYHSIWGSEVGAEDLKQGQAPILTDSKNLIEISVGAQTYRCYIEFVTPPPGALSAAMYLTDEDRSPWILGLAR